MSKISNLDKLIKLSDRFDDLGNARDKIDIKISALQRERKQLVTYMGRMQTRIQRLEQNQEVS